MTTSKSLIREERKREGGERREETRGREEREKQGKYIRCKLRFLIMKTKP